MKQLGIVLLVCWAFIALADDPAPQPSTTQSPAQSGKPEIDFSNEESYIDRNDALRSKRFVHRAILSNAIKETTSHFSIQRPYINHLIGFSNIWQRKTKGNKYVTGFQSISAGYIFKGGHGAELGVELSSLSNISLTYRYFVLPSPYSVWPFVGAGLGSEISGLSFGDAPKEAKNYVGTTQMYFGSLGLVIPLIDVGLKAEVRGILYGSARFVLSTGVGAVVFL